MGNAVLTLPRRWTEYGLRPVVSGGLGVMHVSVLDTGGVFPVSSNLAGFNVGGGAVGFLTKRTGLRFDARYFSSLHRTDQGSIAFGFGRPAPELHDRLDRHRLAPVVLAFRPVLTAGPT